MAIATDVLSKREEKTRRLIIDNASKIFFDQGFRNISVEELCEVVGVSKGSFYKYFANRDALVETILDECYSELMPLITENFNSDKDVEEIIETHYDLMVDFFMSRVSVRMLADIESQMPQRWKRIEKLRRVLEKGRKELFKRGQRQGTIRKDMDPETMSIVFDEIIESIFSPSFLISKDLTLKQAGSTIKNMLLRGIVEPNKKR
jgi:AcrR family transcriptional regulator